MSELAASPSTACDRAAGNAKLIKGDWVPPEALEPAWAAFFYWPPRPKALLRFFFGWNGYLWPRPIFYFGLAWLSWAYLTPERSVASEISFPWIWPIWVRNVVMVAAVAGFWNFVLYGVKTQGTQYKYNKRWPDGDNPSFFLHNQLLDNLFYTFVSAVPIFTAWEIFGIWMQANDYSPTVSWEEHPIYLTCLLLLIPVFHLINFHLTHWLIHWGPLYRWVHSVHHRNVNPGPWSALSMHPVEAFLTFASVAPYLVIPSNELIITAAMLFNYAAATPAHLGFGRVVVGPLEWLTDATDNYYHYLHHRYYECNYSGSVIDKWFGTWRDGTVEAHERMKARIKKRNLVR